MTREEAIRILASSCIPGSKQTEALETLIPELTESEYERIRKDIINLIYWLKGNPSLCSQYYNDRYDGMLDWLEKQKDINCLACDQHLKGYLAGRKVTEEEKQKEQKPAESISQLTVQGKGVYKICPRCKERMVRDDSMIYTSMPPQYRYECPKCGESECDIVMYDNPEMEEQKPAEWSDEDERIRKAILGFVNPDKGGTKYSSYAELVEWSNWLKSLCPQPKRDCKDCAMFLNGKCTKPHWKPSEEQMKALLNAEGKMREFKFIAIASKLADLYEDLKKLKEE